MDHRGAEVRNFVSEYFGRPECRALLIAGAGFDPRTTTVTKLFASVLRTHIAGLFLREERPDPDSALVARADRELSALQSLVAESRVERIGVFDRDSTSAATPHVVAGRYVAALAHGLDLTQFTDVVIDFSALSVGTSFPLARALLARMDANREAVNLHAMVTTSPLTDARIEPDPSTFVGPVHGFQGRWGIDETSKAAKLWLPQLRLGQSRILEDLYMAVRPDDVVPVIPFPAHDPRLGDKLIEHYARELQNEWGVDPRNIIYAAEGDPLDFYRSVLRLDDARRPVFAGTIGSLIILSPLGSKALALGAMLAAIDRDLPVMYVEALGYQAQFEGEARFSEEDLVHVWLCGEAYESLGTAR